MSIRLKRNLLLPLLFLALAALMVQCTAAVSTTQHANGLVCQSSGSSSSPGLGDTKGVDCRFKCPDGRLLSLPGAVVSQSKAELNFLFCGVPLPTPTPGASGQGAPIFTPVPTIMPPLNRGVASCDLTTHILKFTFVQPTPDLTGKTVGIEIQGQPAQCGVMPGFPGILTCKIAPHISLPAAIVVKVNDQTVDAFPYSGFGCYYGQAPRVPHTATPASVLPTGRPTPPPTQPPPTQPPPTQPPPTPIPPTPPPPTAAPTEPPLGTIVP